VAPPNFDIDIPKLERERDVLRGCRAQIAAKLRDLIDSDVAITQWRHSYDEAWAQQDAARITALETACRQRKAARVAPPTPSRANLESSLRCIDTGHLWLEDRGTALDDLYLGQLLREAGIEWPGPLPYIEARLQELTRRQIEYPPVVSEVAVVS
jgi:hypothetical protein